MTDSIALSSSIFSPVFQAPKLFDEPAVHPSAVVSERCLVSSYYDQQGMH